MIDVGKRMWSHQPLGPCNDPFTMCVNHSGWLSRSNNDFNFFNALCAARHVKRSIALQERGQDQWHVLR